MWWANSSSNIIYQRNAANTAWVAKGILGTDGTIQWSNLAAGAALANLGYTPANRAGDTFTGTVAMSSGAINEAAVTMTSAATMAIGAATGNLINVSGTTTITAFDTVQAGTRRKLRFTNGLIVAYNSSNLLLPGSADITTSPGDVMEFISWGSGVWVCTDYQPMVGYAQGGVNSNITSLTGLTTPLSVAQGGTGAITSILARLALGIPVTANGFKNFVQTVTTNTAATITADYCPYTGATISLTLSTATTGANALDTGTIAASTWYYTYTIYGTAGVAAIMSLSSSAPTLPTGYTYYCRVGSLRTNASSYLYRMIQYGRKAAWLVDGTLLTGYPSLATGSYSSFTAISTATWTPATASFIKLSYDLPSTGNYIYLDPTASTGGGSTTNPSMLAAYNGSGFANVPCEIPIIASKFYMESGGAYLFALGWEDNL
jgi:hypothetical protein